MKTHRDIDLRSLALAQAIVAEIDNDPARRGVDKARSVCARWLRTGAPGAVQEWMQILSGSWENIRATLLDPSEDGTRLRQSTPFCGVLDNKKRWSIYRSFRTHETA